MMKNKIEIGELIGVLEKIRAEKYPDIPEELVREIVIQEFEQQDDRLTARKKTRRLIDEFLRQIDAGEV